MASLFRARQPAEEGGSGGSGGKLPPPASPYARPQSSPPLPVLLLPPPPPPPPVQTGSSRWLLSLISGSVKLISSVFLSDGSPSSSSASSSDCSSDGDFSSCPGEEEDFDEPKELYEVNQGQKKAELPSDCLEGSKATIQPSESKLAIEQLLMLETFSREECNRLIKMIESKIVDSPSMNIQDSKMSDRGTGIAIGSFGGWQSLTQNLDLHESVPYSTVMEAKKWFEEKKLESDTRHGLVCGPCSLNTDMLHYGIQDAVGSPVDLAKSYMQSLHPRQSPSLTNSHLKTSQPSKMPLFKDESTHTTTNHSLPIVKVFKRKYHSRESPDDNQRVRLRSMDNILESPKFEKIQSLARRDGNETSKVSLAANERDQKVIGANHNSSSLRSVEASPGTIELSAELHGEDNCSNETLESLDEKTLVQICLPKTEKSTSIIASEPEEAVKTIALNHEGSLQNLSSSEATHYELKSEPKSSISLDDNKIREQDGIIDIHHECLVSSSTSMVHGVDPISEAKVMTLEVLKSRKHSDANDVTHLDDAVQASTSQKNPELVGLMEANISMELNLALGITDTKQHGGNPQLCKEANGSVIKDFINSSSAESNANFDFESFSKDNPCSTLPIKVEPSTCIWEGTCEPQGESAIKNPAVHMVDSVGGTRMRPPEQMLIEPPPNTTPCRRKAKVRRRRGWGPK